MAPTNIGVCCNMELVWLQTFSPKDCITIQDRVMWQSKLKIVIPTQILHTKNYFLILYSELTYCMGYNVNLGCENGSHLFFCVRHGLRVSDWRNCVLACLMLQSVGALNQFKRWAVYLSLLCGVLDRFQFTSILSNSFVQYPFCLCFCSI